MNPQRIPLFDVAKALFILLVFIYHVPAIYIDWLHGSNHAMITLNETNIKLVNSFFMAGFFLISGYFLNTTRPFLQCLKKDALTILLPAFTLSLVSNALYAVFIGNAAARFHQYIEPSYWLLLSLGYWFLFALFINKTVTQLLIRYCRRTPVIFTIAMILCVLGLGLKTMSQLPDYFHFQEALMMCPMTVTGYYCRQRNIDISRKNLRWVAWGFIITLLLLWVSGSRIAGFNLGTNFNLDYVPMALWLGISGTAFVLYVSTFLEWSKVLNYMGRLSLPMFCFNFFFIEFFLRICMPLLDSTGSIWLYVPVVLIASVMCSLALSALINTKYLRFLLGKFEH